MVTGLWNVLKESAKIVVTLNHLKYRIWKMKSCITMSLWLRMSLMWTKKQKKLKNLNTVRETVEKDVKNVQDELLIEHNFS